MSEFRSKQCDYCGTDTVHWGSEAFPVPAGWFTVTVVAVPETGLTYSNRYGSRKDYCSGQCALLDVTGALSNDQ